MCSNLDVNQSTVMEQKNDILKSKKSEQRELENHTGGVDGNIRLGVRIPTFGSLS